MCCKNGKLQNARSNKNSFELAFQQYLVPRIYFRKVYELECLAFQFCFSRFIDFHSHSKYISNRRNFGVKSSSLLLFCSESVAETWSMMLGVDSDVARIGRSDTNASLLRSLIKSINFWKCCVLGKIAKEDQMVKIEREVTLQVSQLNENASRSSRRAKRRATPNTTVLCVAV